MWKKGGVARWFPPTSANRFGKIRRKGGRCESRRTSSHSCARYRGYGYQMMQCTLQFFARESDGQSPGLLLLRGSMPAGRGLGLPSGEGGTERSLPARASKAFIELLMLGFPIPRAGLNWFAGVDSLGSQRGQFVLCTLFSPHKTLQVGFDGQPLGLGSGAQLSFQFGMNSDAHEC